MKIEFNAPCKKVETEQFHLKKVDITLVGSVKMFKTNLKYIFACCITFVRIFKVTLYYKILMECVYIAFTTNL